MLRTRSRRVILATSVAAAFAVGSMGAASASSSRSTSGNANSYRVRYLVSDQPGVAAHLDPNLVNAWGLVAGPSTPWWVADNGTDVSTLYDGHGNAVPLVVKVAGAPTGTVFNGGSDFVVHHMGDSGPSLFMFATESGTIRGWNPNVPPPSPSTHSFVVVNRSSEDAIYKGLAIASTAAGDRLYATDFHNGRVDVFDGNFHQVDMSGAFVDPSIPDGYAPFGIQTLDGKIFVTYAKQDADAEDDASGAHRGFVDMYSLRGKLLGRVASRGPLDSPWGLALAPSGFGQFGGDLLVGNFGDGTINAYRLGSNGPADHEGTLRRPNGQIVRTDGLWALSFGNGGPAGAKGRLFFTAGPDDESHGIFGRIKATN
ncbi:MAG: TIGR03118 family protein [Actinomycetota bacterium]